MMELSRIAVVGASLAGLRTVELLRRAKFEGELTWVGEEARLPYDRPPLSKEILRGEWDEGDIALRKKSYDDLDVGLVLGRRAASLDAHAREVELDGGDRIAFDGLVIATGGSARTLPNQPELPGVLTLRTLDDAFAIRAALRRRPRVVVIGAGFIGAEVAASARQLGLAVTIIEPLETPLARSLGPRVGRRIQELHEQRGVEVLCGRSVGGFGGSDRVSEVLLDDGTRLECDLAIVGIGMKPSVSWLEGSGVELEDGVRCDETLSTSVPRIVAAGDVASWYNPLFEERMRVEHWTNAAEQARHAVATLLARPGEAKPFESVPVFWSDQFDIKIQGVGRPRPTDELHVMDSTRSDKLVALYGREGRLVGAVTFNEPPKLVKLRTLIAKRGRVDDALAIAGA